MAEPKGVSGISGAIGYAAEASWGTSKAPEKWMEFLPGETLQRQQTFMRSAGIKAGRMFQTGSRTTPTTRSAGGNLSFEVGNQGMGAWFNLLHGETVTPTKTLTETYTQVHKIGTTDPYEKSMTIVKAAPKTSGGTVDSYCYEGSIASQAEFAIATSGYMIANYQIDAKDESQAQKIGTVTYPTKVETFNFTQCEVKLEGTKLESMRDIKVTFAKPTDTNRFFLGSATRAQPLTNAFNTIKVDLTSDYTDNTLYKYFEKTETKKLELLLKGAKFSTDASYFELKFVFPLARFEGDSPNIKDLGVLQQTIPLMIEDNGTEPPCTLTYVSTDKEL